MSVNKTACQEIIEKLIKHIHANHPKKQAELISKFAKVYYSNVSSEDLSRTSLEDLYGALHSHWKQIYKRKSGETKIHVFNPERSKDGWEGKYTALQVSMDDMPFLVDSLRMELNRQGFLLQYIVHMGGMKVQRDTQHNIVDVLPFNAEGKNIYSEAPIHIEFTRQLDKAVLTHLHARFEQVLSDVRIAVKDWKAMRDKVCEALDDLEKNPPPIEAAEISETKDFLRWIVDNHFTFLGVREYDITGSGDKRALRMVSGSGLGVLRDETHSKKMRYYSDLPEEARKIVLSKERILTIAKTKTLATVHRSAYTDFIGIKRFNKKGEIIGELRIIGLYTSAAYNSNPKHIPFLRHKVATVLQRSNLLPTSHAGKTLLNILETLPRDDLFQASEAELLELSMGILQLQERQRVRLFMRKDIYGRYFSCLIYVPRERFNTDLRQAMEMVLMEELHGVDSSFTILFSDSILARIHFIIRVNPQEKIAYDVRVLERKLIEIARSWQDDLQRELFSTYGDIKGTELAERYLKKFPAAYREDFTPEIAVVDIEHIERLTDEHPIELHFYHTTYFGKNIIRFKLFNKTHPFPLSDVLPILENMGLRILDERPYYIDLNEGNTVWINDFDIIHEQGLPIEIEAIRDIFQDAFVNVWFGKAENDGFNKLILTAHLTWRETMMLRFYARYMRQIGFTFSQQYIEETLNRNYRITWDLVKLFSLRFEPSASKSNQDSIAALIAQIKQALEAVASLDEDRILRQYLELIEASVRTNYFQKDAQGNYKGYISIKFDPSKINDLPRPKPLHEIFVYSPRFEAVHLRGSKIARGGLRWSDRREDFRTEVLGLMKAQKVKNGVIVPGGAKGGFVVKMLPENAEREVVMHEVVECYKNFIRGMLDITDNILNTKIQRPKDVVCYDIEDPYLVVAADKGTATFSDIANGISKDYGFWLGDAFASGGSAGYDHKKMGITARGAWESVKRHFREFGVNTQTQDFTVVGIGDMSGDVFGNGMLLSQHIKLVAAFNHMHIFIDPSPDPKKSFAERKRLFELPRSSWEDYNTTCMSKGGGIFKRSAKSIKLTPEMKKLLDVNKDTIVPNELIQAILKAPVDLLWNGGIGTYVKASSEVHADVGDRSNDPLRVNGSELRAKVVGEGGNLGFTQLARVEYELNGGRVYSDFIDNSAGVDCSDHEVNIKILLNSVISAGDLNDKQRNRLLAQMSEDVSELVIKNNYKQTQALSIASRDTLINLDIYSRYINELSLSGKLDPALEFLPDAKTMADRKARGHGYTIPELGILLAYTKNYLKEEIIASDLPEDSYFIRYLQAEFPNTLNKRFAKHMQKHILRREIIATQLVNKVVNDAGIVFIYRLHDETGACAAAIMKAFVVIEDLFKISDLRKKIEDLDLKIPSQVQYEMMIRINRLLRRCARWLLTKHSKDLPAQDLISLYQSSIDELRPLLLQSLSKKDQEKLKIRTKEYTDKGVPVSIAKDVAASKLCFTALDIVDAAKQYQQPLQKVVEAYYFLGNYLELDWLRDVIASQTTENHWESLARAAFRDDLDWQQKRLAVGVLKTGGKNRTMEQRIAEWSQQHEMLIRRWRSSFMEMQAATPIEFIMFSVVLRELQDLTQASLD